VEEGDNGEVEEVAQQSSNVSLMYTSQ
jgi:hypothetical protein